MSHPLNFQSAVSQVQAGGDVFRLSQALVSQLNKEETLALLHGDPTFWKGMSELFTNCYATKPYLHSQVERLGIPGIRYCDGPRGVNINKATVFPCSMARGATWDPRLEEAVGRAIGIEARVSGANCVGSICVNLPRHPAWGHAQETYSEDPLLLGDFGVAHVLGLQRNVMACVKHFALNSIEKSRFRVNVSVDDAALHEVFWPHFKRCVDAGALSIMTAYNAVNGEWAGESYQLIRDILRTQWKYDGITITDWLFGAALSLGELRWPEVEIIAARVIRNQLRFYAIRQTEEPADNVVFSKQHRDLAREVATRSIVLVNNEKINGKPLLPLPSDLASCAIIGRHAGSALTGDRASSWVDCPEVVTPYQGIKDRFPNTAICLSASDSEEEAIAVAKTSEVAILVVGYDGNDEGEFLKPSREDDAAAFALFPEPDDSPEARAVQDVRAKAQAAASSFNASDASRPDDDLSEDGYTYAYLTPDNFKLPREVVRNKVLAPDTGSFKALIFPDQSSITHEAVKNLIRFAKSGLPIIIVGRPVYYPSNRKGDEARTWAAFKVLRALPSVYTAKTGHLVKTLRSIGVVPAVGIKSDGTWLHSRRRDEANGLDAMFVLGAPQPSRGNIEVTLSGTPYAFDPWTGKKEPILEYTVNPKAHTISIPLALAGNETKIIVFSDTPLKDVPVPKSHITRLPRSINGYQYNSKLGLEFHVVSSPSAETLQLNDGVTKRIEAPGVPGAIQLKNWTLTTEHWEARSNLSDASEIASKRNTTHKLTSPLKPWTELGSELTDASGVGYYESSFIWPPGGGADGAYIEFSFALYAIKLWVNGKRVPPLNYDHPVADIGPLIRTGRNQVLAVVPTTMWNYLRSMLSDIWCAGSPPLVVKGIGLIFPAPAKSGNGLLGNVTVTPYRKVDMKI